MRDVTVESQIFAIGRTGLDRTCPGGELVR